MHNIVFVLYHERYRDTCVKPQSCMYERNIREYAVKQGIYAKYAVKLKAQGVAQIDYLNILQLKFCIMSQA